VPHPYIAAYRWRTPQDWLDDYCQGKDAHELHRVIRLLFQQADPDTIQDLFQDEMEAAGYFTPQVRKRTVLRRQDAP